MFLAPKEDGRTDIWLTVPDECVTDRLTPEPKEENAIQSYSFT